MDNKVVAHFLNGRVVKGTSLDVNPSKAIFHVLSPGQGTLVIALADLKALFFVKDLQGNPDYRDHQALEPADPRARGARQLELRFRDGERLVGLAPVYDDARSFFYVLPVDPQSNNMRILVNRAAVQSVTRL